MEYYENKAGLEKHQATLEVGKTVDALTQEVDELVAENEKCQFYSGKFVTCHAIVINSSVISPLIFCLNTNFTIRERYFADSKLKQRIKKIFVLKF